MGTVLLHHLRDHLHSLRFQLIFAVMALFFAANGIVYAWKMQRETTEAAGIVSSYRARMEARTLRQAVDNTYEFLLPAPGTEFMTEGGLNWLKDSARISPATGRMPLVRTSARVTNAWMERFDILDWTFIVRVVLSFMAIAMAYNAVSGEVESGTLRLVLTNPLSRARFAVAKLASHLLVLAAAVVVGTLVSLVILSTYGPLALGWGLVRACALFMAGDPALPGLVPLRRLRRLGADPQLGLLPSSCWWSAGPCSPSSCPRPPT
ncbi:MAG: ABC transporter permease subunit [Candidatus Latescibacterota bacterium]